MARMTLLQLGEDVDPALNSRGRPFGDLVTRAQTTHAEAVGAFQRADADAG